MVLLISWTSSSSPGRVRGLWVGSSEDNGDPEQCSVPLCLFSWQPAPVPIQQSSSAPVIINALMPVATAPPERLHLNERRRLRC